MSNPAPGNDESDAAKLVEHLVSAWNQSSFEAYCQNFTQQLVDHYNPSYFTRLRAQGGEWLNNHYLGCLKQGSHFVHLWRARFANSANDVLFSLTVTPDGKVAGLLKRSAGV